MFHLDTLNAGNGFQYTAGALVVPAKPAVATGIVKRHPHRLGIAEAESVQVVCYEPKHAFLFERNIYQVGANMGHNIQTLRACVENEMRLEGAQALRETPHMLLRFINVANHLKGHAAAEISPPQSDIVLPNHVHNIQ